MRVQPKTIYVQKAIYEKPQHLERAQAILSRFPEANLKQVDSHWRIAELSEGDPRQWLKNKRDVLVLGIKAGLTHTINGRSADFIAASVSNGCLSSCQYCYVARHKGASNPLTIFVNIEDIANSIERHQKRLGPKTTPNQCDPKFWAYDIGCNADLSIDAHICDHPGYLIERFRKMEFAKATFATKTVNDAYWLAQDPQGKTRIRYSVMPPYAARKVDVGTSPVQMRLASVNGLVEAGYEVHLNFSPIIMYEGDRWKTDWLDTFQMIDDMLSPVAKRQLACEAFFLSHSPELHDVNLEWNPRGEELLWTPEIQTQKLSKSDVLVYDYRVKAGALSWFKAALSAYLPYCPVRYSF